MTHKDSCVGSVPRSTRGDEMCQPWSEAAGSEWVLPRPGRVTLGKFWNFSFVFLVVSGHRNSRGCCKE